MFDTIETHTIERDGFTIRIDVRPDEDSTPFDSECYTPAQIAAWRRDKWFYVGYVYTATLEGVELGTASIWGTEWDILAGEGKWSSIDAWIAENYYHPDLMAECIDDARATLARLAKAVAA